MESYVRRKKKGHGGDWSSIMATVASENLLKAVLEIQESGEQVIAARLAEFLHVSSAAISMALKRLQAKGHVRISNKRSIQLTPAGFRAASDLVRRHRLGGGGGPARAPP